MAAKDKNWSKEEINASVDAYFGIFRRVKLQEKFVMAKVLRGLIDASLPRRNEGSVEQRMSNISAVLIENGMPWCEKFKPRKNVGTKVKEVIVARIKKLKLEQNDLDDVDVVRDDEPEVETDLQEASRVEGRRRLLSHYVIERNSAAADRAKELNKLANNGHYCCMVCLEKPELRYGVRVIDAHHIRPISEAEGEYQVRPQDFLIVCPNCHRAIHRLKDFDGAGLRRKLG
jgi:predicted HNH restriction endonuclease